MKKVRFLQKKIPKKYPFSIFWAKIFVYSRIYLDLYLFNFSFRIYWVFIKFFFKICGGFLNYSVEQIQQLKKFNQFFGYLFNFFPDLFGFLRIDREKICNNNLTSRW